MMPMKRGREANEQRRRTPLCLISQRSSHTVCLACAAALLSDCRGHLPKSNSQKNGDRFGTICTAKTVARI
eukprot:3169511-Rhodomonas_salina.2